MTRWYCTPFFAAAAFALSMTAARADQYPTLDVAPVCHGITQQSDLQGGFRSVSFEQCIQAEKEDRDAMIKEWSNFLPDEKRHCIAEVTMGGESSYTELITCLEMARDVRLLHQTNKPGQENANKPDQSTAAPGQSQTKTTQPHPEGGQ